MGQYNTLGAAGTGVLQQDMLNPMQQSGFQQNLQMGNQNAFNLATRNNTNIANRASMFGGNNEPGFLQNLQGQNNNWLAGQQSQNFNQNLLYSDQLRQSAATQSLGYRPLQTGGTQQGTSTQSTGGVGAWAGPLISAGVGAATGGMSGMFGGGGQSQSDSMFNPYGNGMATPYGGQGSSGFQSGQGDQSSIQPSMYSAPNNPWG